MKTSTIPSGGPLAQFIEEHGKKVIGVLQDFDRVRVQASLRRLYHQSVMEYYLLSQKLLFKDKVCRAKRKQGHRYRPLRRSEMTPSCSRPSIVRSTLLLVFTITTF